MNIHTEYLEVKKTARFSTYGQLTEQTKYFWFVLHGSHMQCEQMIYKFKDFDPQEHFIIAPEGLSRFYEKGFSGNVVSTWMTSRDRMLEIKDFIFYLTTLYKKWDNKLPQNCKKIVLGFSQGGTSLFRWLHADEIVFDYCIGYSCWIPEDINLKQSKSDLLSKPLIYTYGFQDQFLTEKRIEQIQGIISTNNLSVIIEGYEGDHRVDKDQLKFIFDKFLQS